MNRWWIALVLVGCGDDTAVEAEAGAEASNGSGGETTLASTTSDEPPVLDTSGTTGPAPEQCVARRYPLLDDEQCHHAAIGDLDADGHADLFVIPGPEQLFIATSSLRRLHMFRGGEAELQAPELHCCVEVYGPTSLGLLDVNGDGRMDPLYTVDHDWLSGDVGGTRGALDLLVRGPMGGYLPERSVAGGDIIPLQPLAALGAFVPDRPAVVVSDGLAELRVLGADELSLLSMTDAPLVLSSNAHELATTDLDADGIDDVVARLADRVALVRSAGDGTLTLIGETTPPSLGRDLLVGDLDGVGGSDVVVVGDDGIAVGLVSPDAVVWHAQPEIAITSAATLVDLDMDAIVDLVTVDGTTLVVYRGRSDGTFASEPSTISQGVGESVKTIVAGDLDGDTRTDVAVCDALGVLVVSIAP